LQELLLPWSFAKPDFKKKRAAGAARFFGFEMIV
jgi:hypothetical protein